MGSDYLRNVMCTALLWPAAIRPQICMLYENAKALHCKYERVLLFHRCDRLPGKWQCINYNEDKRSAIAARMQIKVVVE